MDDLVRDREALASLLGTPAPDPGYRAACLEVVRLAARLDQVDVGLDQFLVPFLADGPRDQAECGAFRDLARHYSRHGFAEAAAEVLDRLLARHPDDSAASALRGVRAPLRRPSCARRPRSTA